MVQFEILFPQTIKDFRTEYTIRFIHPVYVLPIYKREIVKFWLQRFRLSYKNVKTETKHRRYEKLCMGFFRLEWKVNANYDVQRNSRQSLPLAIIIQPGTNNGDGEAFRCFSK